MSWTDDPIRDFNRWDYEQWEKEQALPVCDRCGRRIREAYAYRLDGELICEKCINEAREWI